MPVNGLDIETRCYSVEGTKFVVDKRYTIEEAIMTHGAYGIVCSAIDQETGEPVAVKKIKGIFEHISMAKRTLRELRILRHLQHENLVRVKCVFSPTDKADIEDIYVVSELMESDLSTTLKTSRGLTDDHYQFLLYQLLRGMKYVHSAQVIHRDLKPSNMLVNSNCDLKICDFGLARVSFSEMGWVCPMTEYICTRWYRAPEVLCSWTSYSCAIDVWSIGCIVAEMLTRMPLFPGENTQQQLDMIISIIGAPSDAELVKMPNEKCRKFIKTIQKNERQFISIFSGQHAMAIDFLEKTLRWDPESRITVEDAIKHEYLGDLHCPEDEPIRETLDTFDFEFERRKVTFSAIREEIFWEALYYYRDPQENAAAPNGYNNRPPNRQAHAITSYPLLVPGESQYSSDDSESSDISSDFFIAENRDRDDP